MSGYRPIGTTTPSRVTTFGEDSAEIVLENIPFPSSVHPEMTVKALITGFDPLPYAPRVIGLEEDPDLDIVSVP